MISLLRKCHAPLVSAALLVACGGSQPPIGAPGAMPRSAIATHAYRGAVRLLPEAQRDKIKHVVIVIQMQRSFNNLFNGFPRARTVPYGYDSEGRKVKLKPLSLRTAWVLGHELRDVYYACNGTGSIPGTHCPMDGFNDETWSCGHGAQPRCPDKYPPYSYVSHEEIKPYLDIATQYVLGDQMYASNLDASDFGSLQYIIAAQDHDTVNSPSGVSGCGGGPNDWIETIGGCRIHPCFSNETLGDELDAVGLSWAYYGVANDRLCGEHHRSHDDASIAYWAIRHIYYGADCDSDIVSPPSQFRVDVKKGSLRTVSWITPTLQDSDEAGSGSGTGPSWVASLVNAVGKSKYWNSTAIFIFWDSYGGWYDPEPPSYLDEDGLGFRVPLLIISPYAKKGFVSHVHYERGSILRFTEDQFGLARLAASDTRAKSPEGDCFNFNQSPRKFIPIKAI